MVSESGAKGPLRNIYNGLEADENVNAYDAKSVGISILKGLEGKPIADTTLQRKFQVITMASKSCMKIGDDVIHIDQQLLFQRLTVTARKSVEDLQYVFKYELCTYPPALFDSHGMMLQSNKSTLADGLWSVVGVYDFGERHAPNQATLCVGRGSSAPQNFLAKECHLL